jgi:hypothetical protein
MGVGIAHHPEMTWEQAMEAFRRSSEAGTGLFPKRTPMRDFTVERTASSAYMRLMQTKETKFVCSAGLSVIARMLSDRARVLLWRYDKR